MSRSLLTPVALSWALLIHCAALSAQQRVEADLLGDGARFNLLGTLESGHCHYEPELLGNGEVVMPHWEEFWARRRVFRLSGEPKRLRPVEQRYYEINVAGVASSRLSLFTEGSNDSNLYLES